MIDKSAIAIIVAIASIILLIVLSIYVKKDKTIAVDRAILSKLYSIKHPILDMIFKAITWFGSLKIIAPIMVAITILLIELNYIKEAIVSNSIIALAVASVYIFKYLFSRNRPNIVLSIDKLPQDPSFPSAHTLQVFITFFMLYFITVSIGGSYFVGFGVYLFLLALAVAISRLYLQVHYPTDILAGILLAIFWASIAVVIY